jgi:hypothetical protein
MYINKQKRLLIFLCIVAAAILAVYFYVQFTDFDQASFTKTGFSVNFSIDSRASVYTNGDRVYVSTKDGVKCYNTNGVERFSHVLNLLRPVTVGLDDIFAVADENGRTLFVFNENGLMYQYTYNMPILYFVVNGNGFSCVFLQGDDHFMISVVDDRGNLRWSYKLIDENMYPISAALSNDSKVLAFAVISTNQFGINSHLYFASWEENMRHHANNIFSHKPRENEIIYDIRFLPNNSLLTFSDAAVTLFDYSRDVFTIVESVRRIR